MTLDEIIEHIGIKPYFREKAGVIYCADCLDIMAKMPEKCVDLVVTDPPYGKQWGRGENAVGDSNHLSQKYNELDWDKLRPTKEYFCLILSKGLEWVIWGGNYFTDYLRPTNCVLVWDKDTDPIMPFADFELAWTSFNKVSRIFRLRQRGFIRDTKDKRVHPTQKPTELMLWVVANYSNPNDIILDPFLGSGTTAVAAKQLGRQYIGIEISEEYCKIAVQRLAQEVMSL